jgi:hypothetical protein
MCIIGPKVDNGQHKNVSAHLQTHTELENGHSGQTEKKKKQALLFVLPAMRTTLMLI